jgi:Protein of unknown function (DUF5132)
MAKEHRQATPAHEETAQASTSSPASSNGDLDGILGSRLATVAAVGIGVALIEAELIPGMLIGIGAMLAPKLLNRFGSGLRPLVKGAVRAGYAFVEKTKETVADASEHYQDIVAEVQSEQHAGKRGGRRA